MHDTSSHSEAKADDLVERVARALEDKFHWASSPVSRGIARAAIAVRLSELRKIVDEQAEDEGLWFIGSTCSEAYLQAALRRIHDVIKKETLDAR